MIKKLVIFFLLAPLLAVTLWAAKAYYLINIWQFEGEAQVFQVRSGEAFPSINARLAKVGLISSSRIFYRYAQYHGLMGKFRRGNSSTGSCPDTPNSQLCLAKQRRRLARPSQFCRTE